MKFAIFAAAMLAVGVTYADEPEKLTTENGTVVGVNATEILPNITGTFNNMNMTVDGNNSTSGLRGNSTGRRLCGGAHCSAFSGHYWHQYACSSCACTGHACDQNMYQSWCPSCSGYYYVTPPPAQATCASNCQQICTTGCGPCGIGSSCYMQCQGCSSQSWFPQNLCTSCSAPAPAPAAVVVPAPTPAPVVVVTTTQAPKVDCVYKTSGWTTCKPDCGTTCTESEIIVITTQAANGGKACPLQGATRQVQGGPCKVNCEFEYGPWSPCTETCGSCTQTKTLKITKQAANGGVVCPTAQTLTQTINLQPCPVDCVYTYTNWSSCAPACDQTCTEQRAVEIITEAQNGGKGCGAVQTRVIKGSPCPAQAVVTVPTEAPQVPVAPVTVAPQPVQPIIVPSPAPSPVVVPAPSTVCHADCHTTCQAGCTICGTQQVCSQQCSSCSAPVAPALPVQVPCTTCAPTVPTCQRMCTKVAGCSTCGLPIYSEYCFNNCANYFHVDSYAFPIHRSGSCGC